MHTQAIKTEPILPNRTNLLEVIDKNIVGLQNNSIVAISSKIVSLCESSVERADLNDKDTFNYK